jgi:hypothetical protein
VSEQHDAAPLTAMVLVRRGLLALTVIGILATAFELATERHWNGLEQLIPWLALVVITTATALLLLPDDRGTSAARILAVIVLGASAYGVVEHILVNFEVGALDQRFADSWDSLPLLERSWYAATKTVGPAPPLAPAVLGQVALLLTLASLCTPRRRRSQAVGRPPALSPSNVKRPRR